MVRRNCRHSQVLLDIPLGASRPEIDQMPSACKNWFSVARWADVSKSWASANHLKGADPQKKIAPRIANTGRTSFGMMTDEIGNRYEINLLPALPTAWPTGSVKGLRARRIRG